MRRVSKSEEKTAGLLLVALIITSVTVGIFAITNSTSGTPSNQASSDRTLVNPGIKITFLTPITNPQRQQWAQLITDNFKSIGIQAENVIANWGTIYDRALIPNSSIVGKSYDEGGFDALFVGYALTPDPDPYQWFSATQIAPAGLNYYLWNDTTNEALLNNITRSTNPSERLQSLKQWQAYAYDQLPSIAILYPNIVNAYAKNVNGSVFGAYEYPSWPAVERWQYTNGNNTSITVAQVGPAGPEEGGVSLSPYHSGSYYDQTVSAPIFGEGGGYGLMMRQGGNQPYPWTMIPYMANSTIAQPNYHIQGAPILNYTFTLYHNIAFQDGTPLDGRDVVWTLRYEMTPQWGAPLSSYTSDIIGSNRSVYWAGEPGSPGASEPLDVYKVHFNLTKPWPLFMSDIGGSTIYPSEVLVNSTNYNSVNIGNWAPTTASVAGFSSTSFGTGLNVPYYYYTKNGTLLSRVGPFGSGPYMYSGYDEQNLVHHLVKFNDYFRRGALESEGFYQIQDYYVQYIPGLTAAVAALRYGNVQVLDSQYHLETSLGVLDPAWSSYVAYQAFDVQELGFNMMNPIWGTGLGTPLGQAHPELAAEAAKHVRRAFEYLVPKDLIIKNITGGQASYGITTPITPITGLNDNIVPRNETIENARLLAMQELREAGYNFLPPGELNVQVINSRGIPIDSASVVSFVQPPGQEPLAGLTNTFGNISFTNLIPGNYILRVTKSGYPDAYGNTTVLANQTTSITFVLASTALQLLLNTDKPEYLVNESISITATLLYNGLPVSMAITSVEVRDPGNNLVYISTRQTDGAGICTFTFNAGLNWQTGKYAVFGVSYIDGLGDASALTSFQIVRLVSDVRIESLWVHNPSLITAQNLTLGPLGNYWATGALMNYGNGSAFVSKMTFKYPANLPANYVQAILATPFGNLTYLSYVEIDNTICVYNVTLPRYSVLAVIVDTNITRSASYTSVTKADWQDTHFLTKGSGSKSLTLNAVWDTSNPVIITSFRNTGTNSTGGYINVRATLKNVGVANVTFVCIVQVTDSHGAPLTPVIQSVKLVPGQSLVVNIRVNIPSSAPKGTYAINFSLYTDLPSKGGHAINYELATATIH